jgi:ribosomal protein S4
VYLQLNKFKLPKDIEEGLCEFFAFTYLQHKWDEKPTRKLYLQAQYIRKNQDPIYGGGFQKVNKLWSQFQEINKGKEVTLGDFLNHLHIKYHKDRIF